MLSRIARARIAIARKSDNSLGSAPESTTGAQLGLSNNRLPLVSPGHSPEVSSQTALIITADYRGGEVDVKIHRSKLRDHRVDIPLVSINDEHEPFWSTMTTDHVDGLWNRADLLNDILPRRARGDV